MATDKHLYKLSGDPSEYAGIVAAAKKIGGVVSASVDGDALELDIDEFASEYDVFCALNEICEARSVELDDYFNEEEFPAPKAEVPENAEESVESAEEQEEKGRTSKSGNAKLPDEEKGWKIKYLANFIELGIAAVLLIIAAIFDFSGNTEAFLCLIAFSVVGYEIILDAASAIYHKRFFDQSVIMMLASVAAVFAMGYLEAAFIAFIFEAEITLSKVLTDINNDKLKKRFYFNYMEMSADSDETIFACEVEPGTEASFKAGQTIPFDCVVLNGTGKVDAFNYSGTHTAKAVKAGDTVFGGAVLSDGEVTVQVEKTVEESLCGTIYKGFEEQGKTLSSEKVKKISRYAFILNLVIALLTAFALPGILAIGGKSYSALLSTWSYAAIIYFGASNVFALLSTDIILWKSALFRALSIGIMGTTAEGLQEVSQVEKVVFDGADTLSLPHKIKYMAKQGSGVDLKNILLKFGVTAKKAFAEDIIRAEKGGEVLLIGTEKALSKEGVAVKASNKAGQKRYVSLGGVVLGMIADEGGVKADARGAIRELSDAGVKSECTFDAAELADVGLKIPKSTGSAGALRIGTTPESGVTNLLFTAESNYPHVPSGEMKAVAKYVKLARRTNKIRITNTVLCIALKVIAIAIGLVFLFASSSFIGWISFLISGVVGMLCSLNAFRNGFGVY